jgi:hypothetical protein
MNAPKSDSIHRERVGATCVQGGIALAPGIAILIPRAPIITLHTREAHKTDNQTYLYRNTQTQDTHIPTCGSWPIVPATACIVRSLPCVGRTFVPASANQHMAIKQAVPGRERGAAPAPVGGPGANPAEAVSCRAQRA